MSITVKATSKHPTLQEAPSKSTMQPPGIIEG